VGLGQPGERGQTAVGLVLANPGRVGQEPGDHVRVELHEQVGERPGQQVCDCGQRRNGIGHAYCTFPAGRISGVSLGAADGFGGGARKAGCAHRLPKAEEG
jgi:hypothetical protein